jgi:hypothetical protein
MAGEVSTGRFVLFLPAGVTITTADSVAVDGKSYEVTGQPEVVQNLRLGVPSHVEVAVTRVAGAEDDS